ncbi:MAG: restriction endonuclease subunit S [Bacteroidaceae bacterium]|nr:restriction endonuclease subunit S [Bacteroidaceae bacterium]
MKHYSTYQSQFIEMFEGDKYPRISLDAIADEWLKGQAFKKDEICENGDKHCIHYGELFTKYGPVIKEVVSKTSVDLKKPSKNGDILFPASDVTPNGLARCSMLPYDNVVLGGDIIVLRPKEGYSPAYLSYAINQQTTQLLARVNGGLVKHLSAKGLKTVEIPIPSKEKQEEYIRIAEQADKSKFSNLKSQFIEMFGNLDTNIKSYPVTTVEKISLNLFAGGDKPEDTSTERTDRYIYPVWANGEGERGLMGYSKTYRVDKEALTISARGTIGYCAIREPYFTPIVRLITLIPNEKVDIVYLKYFFDQTGFESTGAVQGQLTIPTIKVKKVLVPPIEEQMKFAEVVKQADKSKLIQNTLLNNKLKFCYCYTPRHISS